MRKLYRSLVASDILWGLAVGLPVAAAMTARGPVLTADTPSYLEYSVFRDPLTPLYLGLLRLAASGASLHVAVFLQVAFTFWATGRLARSLAEVFGLPLGGSRLLHLIALLPSLRFAPEIGSVSLAFPLCTAWTADAIRVVASPQHRQGVLCLLVWQCLALLARSQAIVLVPFSLLLCALAGRGWERAIQVFGVIAAVSAAMLLQAVYHWAANGAFGPVRSTGVQLLTSVAYVLQEEDLGHVRPGEDRRFIEAVYRKAHEDGLLASQNAPNTMPTNHHFGMAYNALCWKVIAPQYAEVVLHRPIAGGMDGALRQMSPAEWRGFDSCTRRVALDLLRCSYRRYLANVGRCIFEIQKFYLLIVIVVLGVGLSLLRADRKVGGSLVLISSLWCVNTVSVALVEYPMTKYTYYFDVPLCAATAAICLAFRYARVYPSASQDEGRSRGIETAMGKQKVDRFFASSTGKRL